MEKKKSLRVGLKHKNQKIFLNVEKVVGLKKIFGLMFTKKENARALFFEFHGENKPSLHSWFVFYDFLAIWFDKNNKILEIKVVKPFSLNVFSQKPFIKIIEIPINRKYSKIIKKLVGKGKI